MLITKLRVIIEHPDAIADGTFGRIVSQYRQVCQKIKKSRIFYCFLLFFYCKVVDAVDRVPPTLPKKSQ